MPSAITAACWEEEGLVALTDAALNTERHSSRSVIVQILAYAAGASLNKHTDLAKYLPAWSARMDSLQNTFMSEDYV